MIEVIAVEIESFRLDGGLGLKGSTKIGSSFSFQRAGKMTRCLGPARKNRGDSI